MPTYYAYHLQFPSVLPYDNDVFRWPSFLGEFLAPILRQHPQLQCCASYYGNHAEFYAYTDDFAAIQPSIETLESVGFTANNMNRTLEENFGSGRFLGSNSTSNSTQRAELILAMLRSFSDLLVDSIYRLDDGYWTFEQTADKSQNPIGNHFYSVLHLCHLASQTQTLIYPVKTAEGKLILLDYYSYMNHQGNLKGHTLITAPQPCLP